MKIPNLPTDSLYKFVCLSGLILMIASPIYYQVFSYDVVLKNMDLRLEMKLSSYNITYLKEDVDELMKDTSELKAEILEYSKKGHEMKNNKLSASEFNDRLIEYKNLAEKKLSNLISIKEKQRESEINELKLTRFGEEVLMINKKLRLLKYMSYIGFICGLALFIVGLFLWYSRVQVYQDKILYIQANNISSNNRVQ